MANGTKEDARKYMQDRAKSKKPPPSQAEIRRMLGWDLIEMQRNAQPR